VVPCTVGLRDDLAEDHDGAGGDDDGEVLRDQFVQEDRQGLEG
jgi:hypothetical protein